MARPVSRSFGRGVRFALCLTLLWLSTGLPARAETPRFDTPRPALRVAERLLEILQSARFTGDGIRSSHGDGPGGNAKGGNLSGLPTTPSSHALSPDELRADRGAAATPRGPRLQRSTAFLQQPVRSRQSSWQRRLRLDFVRRLLERARWLMAFSANTIERNSSAPEPSAATGQPPVPARKHELIWKPTSPPPWRSASPMATTAPKTSSSTATVTASATSCGGSPALPSWPKT